MKNLIKNHRYNITNLFSIVKYRFSNISHSIEPFYEFNQYHRAQIFSTLQNKSSQNSFEGYFNTQGSVQHSKKFVDVAKKILHLPNLKNQQKLQISSIGVGTYKGSLDSKDNLMQFNALIDSILFGMNVIDTCSNFRGGLSEKIIGKALRYLIQKEKFQRKQLFLSSKVGYVRQKIDTNNIKSDQIINSHCVHPLFLQKTLNHSLDSMGIKTLDVFYLNNFSQCQKQELGQQKWVNRLSKAFEFMQEARKDNQIKWYGMSSWEGFRIDPKNKSYVNLESIVKIAQKVGGVNHGFRFVQMPINIMMPEGFAQKNQKYGSLLQTAEFLKINVISQSPLMNGSLINIPLPADKLLCRHNGAKHLQFIRSIPSHSLVCTLIGQKQNRHVKKNAQVLSVPMLDQDQWLQMIVPNRQPQEFQFRQQDDEV